MLEGKKKNVTKWSERKKVPYPSHVIKRRNHAQQKENIEMLNIFNAHRSTKNMVIYMEYLFVCSFLFYFKKVIYRPLKFEFLILSNYLSLEYFRIIFFFLFLNDDLFVSIFFLFQTTTNACFESSYTISISK